VPSIAIRSVTSCRWGLVIRPVRRWNACSRESIIRVTDVFPLVPAMWIAG
jgi:hypothetical protein